KETFMTQEQQHPIGSDTLITRTTSVLTAEIRNEIVMMDVDSGRYLGLDDIGGDIWRRLEAPRTFAQLLDGLVSDYEAERTVIEGDLKDLLADMARHKLVTLA
ncbi:MAG TPA: PqqD family protein, partial [Pseudolabrys sp.]